MASLRELAARVTQAVRVIRDGNEISAVTARPSDLTTGTRYRQIEQIQLIFRYKKWVKVAASRNASAVAAVPLRVYRVKPARGSVLRGVPVNQTQAQRLRRDSGRVACKHFALREGWEEVTDDRHPLVKVLNTANPECNGFELIEFCQLNMELGGNGYWSEVYGRERYPVELWNLYTQYTEIRPDDSGVVQFYNYGRPENKIAIKADTVTHFKFPNPFEPYYGLAPLAACVEEADLSSKMSEFSQSFLDNGAVPGAVVFLPVSTKDVREQVRQEFDAKYAGTKNTGKVHIISGKDTRVEYPKMDGLQPVLTESEKTVRDTIAACFDMPVGLLNMEEKSLANGKVVIPHWQLIAIKPRCQRLEDKINDKLAPKFREALNDPTLIVAFDNPVDSDEDATAKQINMLTGGKPVMTQNEARAKMGLPPMSDDGADDLLPVIQVDPNKQPPGEDKPPGKGDSASKSMWQVAHDHECKSLPRAILATVRQMADTLARIFNSFATEYAANPNAVMMGVNLEITREMVAEIFGAVEEPIATTFLFGFNAGVQQIQEQADYERALMEALSKPAVDFLSGYRLRLANEVTQTYEGRIRAIVQTGITEGNTLPQISATIRAQVPVQSPAAANAIARTETSRALNRGKDMAYQESLITQEREWLLSGNPCKVCRAIHKDYRVAKVGEPFVKKGTVVAGVALDYSDVWGGDAHVQCSCGVAPIIKIPTLAS